MHTLMKVIILGALLISTATTPQPMISPVKKIWHGVWHNTRGNSNGKLAWHVNQFASLSHSWQLKIVGKALDSYGEATIAGNCSKDTCVIEQSFFSGQLKGITYVYKGQPKIDSKTAKITSIRGTYSVKGKRPTGTFAFSRFVKSR